MLASQPIPNLIGGVTQQPAALAQLNQGSIVENAWPSVFDGLTKRPPTEHVSQLGGGLIFDTDAYVHFINRDGVERYVVVFNDDGTIKINDANSSFATIPVFYGDGNDQPYIAGVVPNVDLKMITIADTTYVVNRKKTVAMAGTLFSSSPAYSNIAIIQVKTAQNSAVYSVNIEGVVAATYTAAASGVIGTDTVAAGIVAALSTAGYNAGSGWLIARNGSYFHVAKATGALFRIETLDSLGGSAMSCVQNTVNKFTDLPQYGMHGQCVKVAGDFSSTKASSYFVQFFQNTYSLAGPNIYPGPGVWQESPTPNVATTIDPLTMPRQLRRLQDDNVGTVTGTPNQIYFRFDRPSWGIRTAGDDTYNPAPSFVGKTINDIFLFRNRLGFLADTSVVLSESGNFQNFWRRTILQVLPTDPIDVSAAHPRVIKLRSAVQWNQELIIFGDLVQFVLGSDGDVLSASTVKMVATTEFDCDPNCRPVVVQNSLYFPYTYGSTYAYGGIREYYVELYTNRKMGRSITDHVSKYLPGSISKIAFGSSADMILCMTTGDLSSLYVYKWSSGMSPQGTTEKVQSAWHKWTFAQPGVFTQILGIQFWGQAAYVVIQRTVSGLTTCTLEAIRTDLMSGDESNSTIVNGPKTMIHLDRKVSNIGTVTSSYDSVNKKTRITLPYAVTCPSQMAVVTTGTPTGQTTFDKEPPAGVSLPILFCEAGGSAVDVAGRWDTAGTVWLGEKYTMTYRFNTFFVRDQNGLPKQGGRLQLRTLSVRYSNTGFFKLNVTAENRPVFSQSFGGLTLGDTNTTPGRDPKTSGKARVLIGCKNDRVAIDLVNDSPLPSKFIDAEWEGEYFERAKRV